MNTARQKLLAERYAAEAECLQSIERRLALLDDEALPWKVRLERLNSTVDEHIKLYERAVQLQQDYIKQYVTAATQ